MPFSNQNPCTYTMKRNNLDIEADILTIAREGSIKTWIVYGANLNFKMIKRYLDGLLSRGMIEQNGKLYMTTEKGEAYRQTILACQGFQ